MAKKPISVLGIFKTNVIDNFNLYELFFLKNYIQWYSSMNENMTKEYFNYDFEGGWVSRTKAIEWGMSKAQLSYNMGKLEKKKVLAIKYLASHKKKSKKVANCNQWCGSRAFVILNPKIINEMLSWETFTEEETDKYKHFIESICGRDENYNHHSIEEGTDNFYKLANDKKSNNVKKEIIDKLNNKPMDVEKTPTAKVKKKEKPMQEPKPVLNENYLTEKDIMAFDEDEETKCAWLMQLKAENRRGNQITISYFYDYIEDIA